MAAAPKKKEIDEEEIEEEIEEEEEEEEEEEKPKKKKAAAKKEEDTPTWAKQIIKILQGTEAPPQAQTVPTPKPPATKEKEGAADLEKTKDQEPQPPKQTSFLSWFW
jgi:hypothetical protein